MAGLWTYEAKIDGYRCLAAKRSSGVVLWSRQGNGFTVRFPEIARGCEKLPTDTLINGEVVALGADGRPSFNALQHSRPNAYLQFYAFDVLVHRGRDVIGLPERLAASCSKARFRTSRISCSTACPSKLSQPT